MRHRHHLRPEALAQTLGRLQHPADGISHHQRAPATGQLIGQSPGQRAEVVLKRLDDHVDAPLRRRLGAPPPSTPSRQRPSQHRVRTLGRIQPPPDASPPYASTRARRRSCGNVADNSTTGTRYAPNHDSTRSRYTFIYAS